MAKHGIIVRFFNRILPGSLLGRLSLAMVAGLMLTQLAGNFIWVTQRRAESKIEVSVAAQNMAHTAASTLRYFFSIPPNYRPLILQQFREMGGTRFFVNINKAPIATESVGDQTLAKLALARVRSTLIEDLPNVSNVRISFAWPDQLVVGDNGARLSDFPENWTRHIVLTKPAPAPILVVQAEIDKDNWLYLATLMPNPYFLDADNPLTFDRVMLQLLSLAAVIMLSILVVRWTTGPLAALSDAAEAFGNGEHMPALPETGSKEFVNTARAFGAMRERIQKYIEDRERLFISISHDLRTPIMRLKLRTELLDDDEIRGEFHEDLDELDMMVKGALQFVKDSDIHENPTEIRLDALIGRMIRSTLLTGHEVLFRETGHTVIAKPLALKRAIGNLLDNALHYAKQVEISVSEHAGNIQIQIRDHGPGMPEEALGTVFDDHVRLDHGQASNESGMGLGLGIARRIVDAHGGKLQLENARDGGLVANIILPGDPARPLSGADHAA
jgi:signal transduction histidine kinase